MRGTRLTEKEARATQKFLGYSYKKGLVVARRIAGKHVDEAIGILQFSPQQAARATLKVLRSAMANATVNHGMRAENLIVKHVLVNKATSYKRIQCRARGRADRINRRNNHTTVVLGEMERAMPAPRQGEDAGE